MKSDPFKRLYRFNDAVMGQPLLLAVRNGFMNMIPFALIGSFALVLLSLPIQSYQDLMTSLFGDQWKNILLYIRDGTFNSFSLIAVVCVSNSYAREVNESKGYVSPLIASMTSLASFMALSGIQKPSFDIANFGVAGIFIALFVALSSSVLFRQLTRMKKFRINLFSDGAHPDFNNALALFFPATITVGLFAAINQALSFFFSISDLQTFLSQSLLSLFSRVDVGFGGGLLFVLLVHIFWFFGVHGSNMLETVAQGKFVPALQINQNLIAAGQQPTQIFTKTFFDTFVLMGGCGAMVCLILAIFIVGKNRSQTRLSRLSAVPVLFNINELMVFGIPIVLNPIYLIPFVLVPLLLTVVSCCAMHFGLVPMTVHPVEWTTPIFMSGYVSTGSVWGSVLQLFNLAVGTLCYIPFVRQSEKAYKQQESSSLKKVVDAYELCEERGIMSSLLSRHDSVGNIARALTSDLVHDLENENLMLHYQPIVDREENIVRTEVLLRWNHPGYGYIHPPLVIALAEEAQIMDRLGQWVLDRACHDLSELKKLGIGRLCFCVNVSTAQFENDGFPGMIQRMLDKYDLAPENLEIEITERLALRVNRKTKDMIDAISASGVNLAMDDFGMGHSSMIYFTEYNFDTIKLDGTLVREITHNANCRNIVYSIIELGKSLHFCVVAEYVEEREQYELLCRMGCDLFQGYLFSCPVAFDELIDYIQTRRLGNEKCV